MPAPIDPGSLRVDDDGVTLLGGWSPSSGYRHFPMRPLCPFTGADDVQPLDLPRDGRVWLWTTVTAPPSGYTGPVPYGLGIVELDGEPFLRVVSRIIGEVSGEGAPVRLVGENVPGPDGEPATTWAFEVIS
jgi:uncharacterized OB-fold protein